mgnify:CR=1 FL=1
MIDDAIRITEFAISTDLKQNMEREVNEIQNVMNAMLILVFAI